MDVRTQQIILIILGILGLALIIQGEYNKIDLIIAGLIGFLSQKVLTTTEFETPERADEEDEK